jgi:hypothetical protein
MAHVPDHDYMPHVPNYALTPYVRTKATRMDPATKYNLKKYYLQPILPESLVKGWCGYRKTVQHPARAAQYPVIADPVYLSKIKYHIDHNAIGWNEDGRLMFVFRKGVLDHDLQNEAFDGLQELDRAKSFWSCNKSHRPELKGAVGFNTPAATVEARELNIGHHEMGRIFKFTRGNPKLEHYEKVFNLLHHMNGVYATTLPNHFRAQNSNVPAKGVVPVAKHRVGIPAELRLGMSAFSTIALLKSAPSAVHKDSKNGDYFACMTSVADPDPAKRYSGGTFCFVKYGVSVAVTPGDILIASTPQDWHANLTPVQGLKYSIVGYYKQTLHNPNMLAAYRLAQAEMAALKAQQATFPLAVFAPDTESL